jgi:hypothetical protein
LGKSRREGGALICFGFSISFIKKMEKGSSLNLSKRMASHFFHARSNRETNIRLYRAMRKYGLENFSLAILEFCTSDSSVCLELEKK